MPWSTALRTRCVSGSRIASITVLSSSVSEPSIATLTCLPHLAARSRTTRGSLPHTLPIGCMRVFIMRVCRSVVMRFSRCDVLTNDGVDAVRAAPLHDLVAGEHQLAHEVHEIVEEADVDADRRVGDAARALLDLLLERAADVGRFHRALLDEDLPEPARIAFGLLDEPERDVGVARGPTGDERLPQARVVGGGVGAAGAGGIGRAAVRACPGGQRRQARHEVGMVVVAFVAVGLDAAEDRPHRVGERQQRVRDVGVDAKVAVAQVREQVLARVRDRLEAYEAEKPACSLDRVERAKRAGDRRAVRRIALEREQIAIQLVETLEALDKELGNDLLVDVFRHVPASRPSRRCATARLRLHTHK